MSNITITNDRVHNRDTSQQIVPEIYYWTESDNTRRMLPKTPTKTPPVSESVTVGVQDRVFIEIPKMRKEIKVYTDISNKEIFLQDKPDRPSCAIVGLLIENSVVVDSHTPPPHKPIKIESSDNITIEEDDPGSGT